MNKILYLLIFVALLTSCSSMNEENEDLDSRKKRISYFGDTPPNPSNIQSINSYSTDFEQEIANYTKGNWRMIYSEPELEPRIKHFKYHFLQGRRFYRSLDGFNTPLLNWEISNDSIIKGFNPSLKVNVLKVLELNSDTLVLFLISDSTKATFIRE